MMVAYDRISSSDITSPFACDDLSLNDSHREALNNQACPIA